MAQEAAKTNEFPSTESAILTPGQAHSGWSPETVLSKLDHRPETNATSPVPFFHILERLKTTKREGWRRFNIVHGESIADHMYRMSIMTMVPPASLATRLNVPHCTRMALIHDMAESLVGDITPLDGISHAEKRRREEVTMDYLCKSLLGNVHGGLSGGEIWKAWKEYEDSETLEAKYVQDIDKLELLLQMVDYERFHGGHVDLGDFANVSTRIKLPEMREWAYQILAGRNAFWASIGETPTDGVNGLSQEKIDQIDEYYGKT
jgi:putative hydrolases of HD superfamily